MTPAVTRWFVVLFALLSAGGCAPRLSALLENRHYREAIYLADERQQYEVKDRVLRALVKDLAPAIHLAPVDEAQLRPLIGAAAKPLLDKALMLKLTYEGTPIPIDELEVRVALLTDNGAVLPRGAARVVLAEFTGEKAPVARQQLRVVPGRVSAGALAPLFKRSPRYLSHWTADTVRAGKAITTDLLDFIPRLVAGMFGGAFSISLTAPRLEHETRYPTNKDWAEQAPIADAIYRGLPSPTKTRGTRRWHGSRIILFTRPSATPRALALALGVTARTDTRDVARRVKSSPARLFSAPVIIPLAAGETLEQQVRRTFDTTLKLVPPTRFHLLERPR